MEDTADDVAVVTNDDDTWAYALEMNTLNIYTDYLIEFEEDAKHYDEARERVQSFMDETGYVPMNVDGEKVIKVELFNKNKDADGFPLPDNVIYPIKTIKIYDSPMINDQSAAVNGDVLVKDQPVIVLDIEQDDETYEVWVKIAYQKDY